MARQSLTPRSGSSSRGRHQRPPSRRSPLVGFKPSKDVCLELEDHSAIEKSAVQFFGTKGAVDPQSQAARLADQFVTQNRPLLELLDVSVRRDYDGSDVRLVRVQQRRWSRSPRLSIYGKAGLWSCRAAAISMAGHRTDAGRNGLAGQPDASAPPAAEAIRPPSTALGSVIHGSGAAKSLA
jgi:hypothetical protein